MKKFTVIMASLALVGMLTGCGNGSGSKQIVVGSKNFTESIILGELVAQIVESNTDIKVVRKQNLGATDITLKAITNGDIDLYAEYDGTVYSSYLKIKDPVTDPQKVYPLVNDRIQKEMNLKLTKPLGFNNTFTLAVPTNLTQKMQLKSYSDLVKVSNQLVLGIDPEFMNREPDGWKGLQKKYGFSFKNVVSLDSGLRYKAVQSNQIQVTNAFATDGQLKSNDMSILKDDQSFFPPYNAAPIVRMDTLKKYPKLEEVLNTLGGQITDQDMQDMNYQVDDKKISEVQVAKDFLKKKGLIK
ncbi:osmoprotectant transport system substrate-binding protein [Paenibacillus sp. yr247]|uniref:ABC transporter substrate-binding protein n=1 Tax=Paenibacillus sp. yr247 TaxID=1761880 RepID=UPI00088EFBB7|nr:glycine betaine ABC transporter substrate-binding protein [Paenibacillus sp. yr247]SDO33369.1 osmoprotectant transport system substrate-binding protein [Paenibacillus sp. yr247]